MRKKQQCGLLLLIDQIGRKCVLEHCWSLCQNLKWLDDSPNCYPWNFQLLQSKELWQLLKLDMKAQAIGVQQVHFSMAHYGGTCWTVSVCSRKAAVLSQPRSGLDWQSALRAPGAEICLLSAWLPFLFLISPLPPPFGLLDFPGDLIVVGELLSSVISDFRSCSCPRSSLTPAQYL